MVRINGHALQVIRTSKQVSASQLALAIGKSRSRIAQIEAMGSTHNRVAVDALEAIAAALGDIDVRALMVDPYAQEAAA